MFDGQNLFDLETVNPTLAKEWDYEKGFLMDTCLTAQDRFKAYLDYFRIAY